MKWAEVEPLARGGGRDISRWAWWHLVEAGFVWGPWLRCEPLYGYELAYCTLSATFPYDDIAGRPDWNKAKRDNEQADDWFDCTEYLAAALSRMDQYYGGEGVPRRRAQPPIGCRL